MYLRKIFGSLPVFGEILTKEKIKESSHYILVAVLAAAVTAYILLPGKSEDSSDSSIKRYDELYSCHSGSFGPICDWTKGEIQLVIDPKEIKAIQSQFEKNFLEKGMSLDNARKNSCLGVVYEDRRWMWIRDAVRFPSGKYDIYNRFMPKSGLDGIPAVGVLTVLPNQKVIVNLIYRHATRSWELELPRGGKNKGESLEDAARREVIEETGYAIRDVKPLGTMASDSGILTNLVGIYFAVTEKSGDRSLDEEEVIPSVLHMSKAEIKEAFLKGYRDIVIAGETKKAFCRDSFFSYALLIAEAQGLL